MFGVAKNLSMGIDISIIIPVKNGMADGVEKCFAGIFSQNSQYAFEIIAIDSGSTDGSLELIKSFPDVRLIQIKPEEFGHGKTRNLGAREANGEYLVFLNADAIPANNKWLDNLLGGFAGDEKIAAVYSRHLPKAGCHLYMVRDLETVLPPKRIIRTEIKHHKFMSFSTVSAAIRREIWEVIPFDDQILIAEDQDWAKKIMDGGLKIVYEPNSEVYHSHNYSLKELFRVKYQVGKAYVHITGKRKNPTFYFLIILAGCAYKLMGDIIYILKLKIGFLKKINELLIAFASRCASFAGRYLGEIGL